MQKYVSESELEPQVRKIVGDCGLHEDWEPYFEKWIIEAEEKDKLVAEVEEKQLNGQIQESEVKLNRLLDGYLDQVIEPEVYKQKKNELFEEKLKLEEKKSQIEKNGTVWLEPMKEFTETALQCGKTARAKNNADELCSIGKTVGSNFFLTDRRLSVSLRKPFQMLCAPPPAHSHDFHSAEKSLCVSPERIELSTNSLKGCCSTVELQALKISVRFTP